MKKSALYKGFSVKINAGSHQYLFIALCLFLSLSGDTGNKTPFIAQTTTPNQEVWLNVFVHGIISIKPHITVTNFIRFLTDNVCESIYGQTVDVIRDDPFFYQNQTIQARGLQLIDLQKHQKGAVASLTGILFEDINQINAVTPVKNYYYTYGWSGLLSRSARYNDAKEFIFVLEKEVAQWRAQGIEPKIRLIGYSHGGTIILKMAMAKQNENLNPNFTIDEALLFGTPIQFDTDYLVADPIFKKVYNIFSRSDRVQKLDFFSCGEFFSDQVFKAHCGFEVLPDKLVQIEIRMIRKKGEACKPFSIQDEQEPLIYTGKKCSSKTFRNVSPGHSELWFYGWTPHHYRKTFLMYPLPTVVFAPYILNTIRPLEKNFKPETPITLTIDPRRDSMIINTNIRCASQIYQLPFIGVKKLMALKDLALSYQPNPIHFNKDIHNERIDTALEQATEIVKAKKCKNKMEQIIACEK